MLWRGRLIYGTCCTQLKWLFNIINQQPRLPCKTNKRRNKLHTSLHNGEMFWQLGISGGWLCGAAGGSVWGARRDTQQPGCGSRGHAVRLGCFSLPTSWSWSQSRLLAGPAAESHCRGRGGSIPESAWSPGQGAAGHTSPLSEVPSQTQRFSPWS